MLSCRCSRRTTKLTATSLASMSATGRAMALLETMMSPEISAKVIMRLLLTSGCTHPQHQLISTADLTRSYYDLATDLYEEGWAQSFHLCRFGVGETLLQALARHEHYLAHRIQIDQSMTVLDVGCGVGKPAREIATFTGCNVVGLNNNAYQVERATAHAARDGLSNKVSFVKGDFMVRPPPLIATFRLLSNYQADRRRLFLENQLPQKYLRRCLRH